MVNDRLIIGYVILAARPPLHVGQLNIYAVLFKVMTYRMLF